MTPERRQKIRDMNDLFRQMPNTVHPVAVEVIDDLMQTIDGLICRQGIYKAEWKLGEFRMVEGEEYVMIEEGPARQYMNASEP